MRSSNGYSGQRKAAPWNLRETFHWLQMLLKANLKSRSKAKWGRTFSPICVHQLDLVPVCDQVEVSLVRSGLIDSLEMNEPSDCGPDAQVSWVLGRSFNDLPASQPVTRTTRNVTFVNIGPFALMANTRTKLHYLDSDKITTAFKQTSFISGTKQNCASHLSTSGSSVIFALLPFNFLFSLSVCSLNTIVSCVTLSLPLSFFLFVEWKRNWSIR